MKGARLLEARGISLPGILETMDLSFSAGEHCLIWGANGSGKTSLARLLAGLDTPGSGEILCSGNPPLPFLFQDPDSQFALSSVRDEVALGARHSGEAPIRRKEEGPSGRRLEETLRKFRLLELRDRNPHALSGGEKRRLGLASLTILDSPVLILDEPELHLDEKSWRSFQTFLEDLRGQGGLLIEISRDPDRALQADRMILLEEGRLIADARPEEVYREHRSRLIPRVDAWEDDPLPPPSSCLPPTGDTLLSVRDLGLNHPGGTSLLENLSLEIRERERILILGDNASGKSSLLKLLAGLADPDRGEINHQDSLRRALALQDPERACFAETVLEEAMFAPLRQGFSFEEAEAIAREALERMGLQFAEKDPLLLSAGEQRRLAIASLLAARPDLLLLDEAAAALDPDGIRLLRRALEGWSGTLLWADCCLPTGMESFFHRRLILQNGTLDEGVSG
ncbi:MAG: ATP-binding cassette domain-containing protein [Candidatus Krumholzibacteria bacterium]|jgi:energy-coupling factor transport system ATP-binding protein|nr:ATP-binding cassette domain-containing protein [Candidatus Krumholzibacteria bacterium]